MLYAYVCKHVQHVHMYVGKHTVSMYVWMYVSIYVHLYVFMHTYM